MMKRCLPLLLLLATTAGATPRPLRTRTDRERPVDVLVIAPHPDDEALCCAGVISKAVARGQRVHVLVMTNGGSWAVAAAALTGKPVEQLVGADFDALAHARRGETLGAMKQLGVDAGEVTLLGTPDNLAELYDATSTVDTRAPIVSTLARWVDALRPHEVYAPNFADTHPGHLATYRFVRDALLATHWQGHLLGYVVHSGREEQWPWPATPGGGYETHDVDGVRVPYDVAWPPPVRQPLTSEVAARKLTAIRTYGSQLAVGRVFLEGFAKEEEIFWPEAL